MRPAVASAAERTDHFDQFRYHSKIGIRRLFILVMFYFLGDT